MSHNQEEISCKLPGTWPRAVNLPDTNRPIKAFTREEICRGKTLCKSDEAFMCAGCKYHCMMAIQKCDFCTERHRLQKAWLETVNDDLMNKRPKIVFS